MGNGDPFTSEKCVLGQALYQELTIQEELAAGRQSSVMATLQLCSFSLIALFSGFYYFENNGIQYIHFYSHYFNKIV